MQKEMIISITLVILIIIGEIITQNYTKKTVKDLNSELEELKQNLSDNLEEDVKKQIEEIEGKWENVHDKLACYIEHDELEKVETNFTACKSLAQTGNYDLAICEVEKMSFVLDHITDKYSFNVVNIF